MAVFHRVRAKYRANFLENDERMKAILIKNYGDIDQLYLGDHPDPQPGEVDILVEVKATALNRADILQRQGKYPPPPGASEVLGLEMAGVVKAIGPKVTRWRPGDKVMALLPGGGYASLATVHEDMAMPIPADWTFEQAAALPEASLTAFQALHLLAGLKKGERVLIHAGASGVGAAAIQLAVQLLEAQCAVTASATKHALCTSLGADLVIDYKKEDIVAAIMQWSNHKGVNVVLDFIGAPYWKTNLDVLQMDGRLVILAMMGGAVVAEGNLGPILRKRLQIMGSTLRNRSLEYKIGLTQSFWTMTEPLLQSGKIKPVVDKVFDWKEVAAAHAYMEKDLNKGKIVLQIS